MTVAHSLGGLTTRFDEYLQLPVHLMKAAGPLDVQPTVLSDMRPYSGAVPRESGYTGMLSTPRLLMAPASP